MQLTTRRTALAGVGAAAAATLAVATILRKPPASPIATPIAGPSSGLNTGAVRLQNIGALVPTDPAASLAPVAFTDADGTPAHLSAFAGKGLVVNLWATWCVPCVAEMPSLASLSRRVADAGIVVLPLSSDHGGADTVRRFLAAHQLSDMPFWLDPKGQAARAWGARGFPTTLIVDRTGKERGRLEGAAEWDSDAAVARLRTLLA